MSDVPSKQLIQLMVGRELPVSSKTSGSARCCTRASRIRIREAGIGIDLTLHTGEIVGLQTRRCGRTELAKTISVWFRRRGRDAARGNRSPSVIRRGDRSSHFIFARGSKASWSRARSSISSNITLASLKLSGLTGINFLAKREIAPEYNVGSVKTPAIYNAVDTRAAISKVALSRWLVTQPAVLDEPTQGVDVGSKAEIHDRGARRARCRDG